MAKEDQNRTGWIFPISKNFYAMARNLRKTLSPCPCASVGYKTWYEW